MTSTVERGAVISDCGRYRYELTRRWAEGHHALWIMLNPSTADADQDDPTIRRVTSFTRRLGCGALVVANLFAYRTTRPAELAAAGSAAAGPENLATIERLLDGGPHVVIVAWGTHAAARRLNHPPVLYLARQRGRTVHCLGTTRDGAPRHPLYVPDDTQLVEFRR